MSAAEVASSAEVAAAASGDGGGGGAAMHRSVTQGRNQNSQLKALNAQDYRPL
jgi:hypothetical protein